MELIKNLDDVYAYYAQQLEIKKNMIKKALDASYEMLKLDDFIRITEFKLPDIMELSSIRQFKADIPVLITKQLVEAFGYSGEYRNQKVALLKLIKTHNFPYIQLTNKEYEEFVCFKFEAHPESTNADFPQDLYPVLKNPNGKSTHILMMPRDLNKLMMVVNTAKGDIMREFCQTLNELFDLYLNYQNEYKSKQLYIKDKKIDELLGKVDELMTEVKDTNETVHELRGEMEEVNDKLDIVVEDRVPKTDDESLLERFVILKLNSPEKDYYVIRAQKRSVNSSVSRVKKTYPDAKRCLSIDYQPNSKNLFNRIKEQLGKHIIVDGNFITLKSGVTHEKFMRKVRKLNEEKKEV